MELDFAETMRRRSTEELRRVCSVEAGDYTSEAIEAARAELVRRGDDVSGLVPAAPREAPPDRRAQLGIAGIILIIVAVPWITYGSQMPTWLHIGGWIAIGLGLAYLRLSAWRSGGR